MWLSASSFYPPPPPQWQLQPTVTVWIAFLTNILPLHSNGYTQKERTLTPWGSCNALSTMLTLLCRALLRGTRLHVRPEQSREHGGHFPTKHRTGWCEQSTNRRGSGTSTPHTKNGGTICDRKMRKWEHQRRRNIRHAASLLSDFHEPFTL